MSEELAQKFVASFRRGIEAEKAALRSDSTAYEVLLERPTRLTEMTQGTQNFYSFVVPRPSERLSAGVQCSLREPTGSESPVTIVQLDGANLVLQTEITLAATEGSWRLVFVPWFLYDEMHKALDEVAFPLSSLRAFGKLPCQRVTGPPPIFDHALNPTQQAAVHQAVESQLTILWGPPGTGKTTTLAELVANLVRRQRRILVTSTTHAALDQVLARLTGTQALQPLFQANQIIQLGLAGQPCSLDQVVNRTQHAARFQLQRAMLRLERVTPLLSALVPVLDRSTQAAAQAQQLDLFAEQPGNLSLAELSTVLPAERAHSLAARPVRDQHAVLVRLARRLEALQVGHKLKARAARQALANGQQQAVDECRILLTTLANSYVSPLLRGQQFDSVIIEEAGMALLPAVYLAAGRASQQVILVGDPQQLPAILASRDAYAQQALGRNIFAVLGERPERIMLDIQYRMHPTIGELVSQLFYGGGLRHAAADTQQIADRDPFPGHPLVVLDGPSQATTDAGDYSRYNPSSAARAVEMAVTAAAQGLSVAVIAPYRKQVTLIQRLLHDRNLDEEQVQCATVHRFQGHERDVVILDITDAPPLEPGVLLAGRGPRAGSANLLNVSISRARGKLIIVADLSYVRGRAAGSVLHQVLEAAVKGGLHTGENLGPKKD